MMTVASELERPRHLIGLLLRVKARAVANRVRQAVDHAPVRLSATAILLATIWWGLFEMFYLVFVQLRRTPLEATVAIPLVFNFFFVAMFVMLTLSNAIIAYGALFSRNESAYLLASPLSPLDVITLKYLESLVLASWSLVLLGFPLMIAMADLADNPAFYVLFLAFFLAFIPIPAAFGLLLAWATARFFPQRVLRLVVAAVGMIGVTGTLWGMRCMLRLGDSATELWLRAFLARMSFVESAFLPNNWVASGIDCAVHDEFSDALLYLGVTVANALFLSWAAVTIVSKYFCTAYDRASSGSGSQHRAPSRAAGGLSGTLFCYLPMPLRLIAAKDLRTFFRDPLQWSQLVILFGLLALYLTNTPTLTLRFNSLGWARIIPFLNLCAISLILATFTCRFVFPLVSLEGHQLWLIGMAPMSRGDILYAKFSFAMTVTGAVAIGSMTLATFMLKLEPIWMVIHLVTTAATCVGLCGLAVGIGARLPMFDETNPARIANGLGGTTNLIASLVLVALLLGGIGLATWSADAGLPNQFGPGKAPVLACLAAAMFGILVGFWALRIGARHISHLDV